MSVKEYITKINENGNTYLFEVGKHACNSALTFPQKCVDFINEAFDAAHLSEEHFYAIATDTKTNPVGVFEVSHGIVDGSFIQPREILIRLLLCGASAAILVHNHPSGCAEPSEDDLETTRHLQEAFSLIGIKLLDHIIIGKDQYCSLREQTLMLQE